MLLYVYRFLFSLIFSITIETFVIWFLLRKQKIPTAQIVTAGIFATALTIPYVWFVFAYLFYDNRVLAVALAEIFAFALETIFYRFTLKISFKQAIKISFVANAASFILGQALHRLAA
ncbi:MAG: hypothetical protein WCJ29_02765 [bacterium]